MVDGRWSMVDSYCLSSMVDSYCLSMKEIVWI